MEAGESTTGAPPSPFIGRHSPAGGASPSIGLFTGSEERVSLEMGDAFAEDMRRKNDLLAEKERLIEELRSREADDVAQLRSESKRIIEAQAGKLTATSLQLRDVESRLSEALAANSQHESRIAQLQNEKSEGEADVRRLRSELAAAKREVSLLTTLDHKHEATINSQELTRQELTVEVDRLRCDANRLRRELDSYRSLEMSLRIDLRDWATQYQAKCVALDEAQRKHDALTQELSNARQRYREEVDVLEKQMRDKYKEREEAAATSCNLKLKELNDKHKDMEEALERKHSARERALEVAHVEREKARDLRFRAREEEFYEDLRKRLQEMEDQSKVKLRDMEQEGEAKMARALDEIRSRHKVDANRVQAQHDADKRALQDRVEATEKELEARYGNRQADIERYLDKERNRMQEERSTAERSIREQSRKEQDELRASMVAEVKAQRDQADQREMELVQKLKNAMEQTARSEARRQEDLNALRLESEERQLAALQKSQAREEELTARVAALEEDTEQRVIRRNNEVSSVLDQQLAKLKQASEDRETRLQERLDDKIREADERERAIEGKHKERVSDLMNQMADMSVKHQEREGELLERNRQSEALVAEEWAQRLRALEDRYSTELSTVRSTHEEKEMVMEEMHAARSANIQQRIQELEGEVERLRGERDQLEVNCQRMEDDFTQSVADHRKAELQMQADAKAQIEDTDRRYDELVRRVHHDSELKEERMKEEYADREDMLHRELHEARVKLEATENDLGRIRDAHREHAATIKMEALASVHDQSIQQYRKWLRMARDDAKFQRLYPYLGLEVAEEVPHMERVYTGVKIAAVKAGGPAHGGGITEDDMVKYVEVLHKTEVRDLFDFRVAVEKARPGDVVTFHMLRGETLTIRELLISASDKETHKFPVRRKTGSTSAPSTPEGLRGRSPRAVDRQSGVRTPLERGLSPPPYFTPYGRADSPRSAGSSASPHPTSGATSPSYSLEG